MAMNESDLRAKMMEFQIGSGPRRQPEVLDPEQLERDEYLTNFLRGSVILVEPIAQKLNAEDSRSGVMRRYREANNPDLLEIVLEELVGQEGLKDAMGEWQRNFNIVLLHGRSLEEFDDVTHASLLADMSRVHVDGNAWFERQKQLSLELSPSR